MTDKKFTIIYTFSFFLFLFLFFGAVIYFSIVGGCMESCKINNDVIYDDSFKPCLKNPYSYRLGGCR